MKNIKLDVESLPENLKQNPKFMLELLANGFRRTASIQEMTESHATFDGFVEKVLSIDKNKKAEFLRAKAALPCIPSPDISESAIPLAISPIFSCFFSSSSSSSS